MQYWDSELNAKEGLNPNKTNAEVTKCAIGSAIVVPRGNLTDGKHALALCTRAMAVHAALATKLAYATPFSPCSQR